MEKMQLLLLNDYLNDSTDIRLSLFANRVNSLFVLNKKNSQSLKQLINDYKNDKTNKMRLKNIESFLGANSSIPKNRLKPSQMKELTPEKVAVIRKEKTEFDKLIEELGRFKSIHNWGANPTLLAKISELQMKVDDMDRERGGFDAKPPEQTYLDIVLGAVGHWDDTESIAYELINGNQPRITINSGQNFEIILYWLAALSQKQLRPWMVQTNKGYGTTAGKFTEQVILTDKRSGLSPIKENNVAFSIGPEGTTEVNGGVAAQIINTIPTIPGAGTKMRVEYTAPVANSSIKRHVGV